MDQAMTEIKSVVNQILVERFEIDPSKLTPGILLKEDLQLDSLDFVDMIVILEDKIGGTMPEFDFTSIKTIDDVYTLVHNLQSTAKLTQ